jgi:hypothetical protein
MWTLILQKIFSVLHRLDTAQQEFFSVLVWSIWKPRNNQVWDNINESDQTVCERARHLITCWQIAQVVRSLAHHVQPVTKETKCSKPSTRRYKCNIDVSFSTTHNKVGNGMCIRYGLMSCSYSDMDVEMDCKMVFIQSHNLHIWSGCNIWRLEQWWWEH